MLLTVKYLPCSTLLGTVAVKVTFTVQVAVTDTVVAETGALGTKSPNRLTAKMLKNIILLRMSSLFKSFYSFY